MTRVVILGCGYVGIGLAEQLVADHPVVGVRRSTEGIEAVRRSGAEAVQADITDADDLARVPTADVVVFAASSGGRGADDARELYVEGLRTAIDEFADRPSPPERLLYTSSTGVYGDHDGDWVDETTPLEPTTEKTNVLAEAESVATTYAAECGIDGTVIRFAGLYGPGRYRLDRYLEGPVTAGYLNMIHRQDAAGVLRFLIETDVREAVILAVDDEPVDRHTFADWLADQCGIKRPPKQSTADRLAGGDLSPAAKRRIASSKRCANNRLRELGYLFTYPTYREGYRSVVTNYRE